MKITLFKKQNNFKKKDFQFNPDFFWKIAIAVVFGRNQLYRVRRRSFILGIINGNAVEIWSVGGIDGFQINFVTEITVIIQGRRIHS